MQGLLLGLGRGLLLPVLCGVGERKKKKRFLKETPKGKCYLFWHLLISPVLSHLFHGASWQPPGNIQALLCCCTFANKVGSSGNQTGRKNIAPTSQPVLAPRRYSVWPVGFELIRNYHTIKSFAYAMYNVEGISSPRTIAENMSWTTGGAGDLHSVSFQEH